MSPMAMQLIMIVGLFAIMYFLLIRPQKKREKQVADMRNSIKVGDDVVTIGGIYGKIVKVKEDRLTIQVGADKTKFDIAKWSISKVENAAPETKKKVVEEVEEEEKPKKVSPKKLKKLGAEEKAEAVPAAESVDPITESPAESPVETPADAAAEPVSLEK